MNGRRLALGVAIAVGIALPFGPAVLTADASGGGLIPIAPPPLGAASLLASRTPKTVVLDPATGAVVGVDVNQPAVGGSQFAAVAAISGDTTCRPGDGCYYTPTVNSIYHDRSFYGSPGTFTGNWPRRSAWDTGSYRAYACWQGACSQWFGPNTYLTFGGALVTGTSFTIG